MRDGQAMELWHASAVAQARDVHTTLRCSLLQVDFAKIPISQAFSILQVGQAAKQPAATLFGRLGVL